MSAIVQSQTCQGFDDDDALGDISALLPDCLDDLPDGFEFAWIGLDVIS